MAVAYTMAVCGYGLFGNGVWIVICKVMACGWDVQCGMCGWGLNGADQMSSWAINEIKK